MHFNVDVKVVGSCVFPALPDILGECGKWGNSTRRTVWRPPHTVTRSGQHIEILSNLAMRSGQH